MGKYENKTIIKPNKETKLKIPSLYKVILINDDFTPQDFVINILQTYFNKTIQDATNIMLLIHTKGSALCGIYTYEIATSKASIVMQSAKTSQHPLKCIIKKT